jgi:alpha-tubulin suppressor-like RCC1 family protein
VAGLDGVTHIAGGPKHVLALKSDGTVWVWGANRYFQLDLGDTDRRGVPTTIPSLTGVTRTCAHESTSAARLADGSWLVWGDAPSAQPSTSWRSSRTARSTCGAWRVLPTAV